MEETSSSSSPFAPKNTNAVATRFPAEKHTPPLRVKSLCSSSATLPSSPSSLKSSSSSSTCSSYFSHLGSPFTPSSPFRSSSAIPFSWEKQPGIPKNIHPENHHQNPDPTLPLPPPLRSNSDSFLSVPRKKRSEAGFAKDPFAMALIECSKQNHRTAAEDEDVPGTLWKGSSAAAASKVIGGKRRTIGDRFGFMDRYGSCKTTCSVADSTVYIPRSGRAMAAYDLLNRRAG